MSKAQEVKSILQKYFTNVGTAALMGNIEVETGGSFDYQQKQIGKGKGIGLFQFDAMRSYYESWLKESGETDSAESQIKFVYETIRGKKTNVIGAGNAAKVREALEGSDLDNATTVFCTLWERPGILHLERRIEAARKYYDP